jgi:hypothetical protein
MCRAHNQPPVIAVCGVADQQRENHRRHELDEPHKAKVQSAVGDFVDLPADRDLRHHLFSRRAFEALGSTRVDVLLDDLAKEIDELTTPQMPQGIMDAIRMLR